MDDAHKTTANVLKRKAFTVHIADVKNVAACDYVGCVSANDAPDKLAKTGWKVSKSAFVDAPVFEDLPMALECELVSYDKSDCRLVGRIVNVAIDESVLSADDKVDVAKLAPITYDPVNLRYHKIGEPVAPAFKVGLALKNA